MIFVVMTTPPLSPIPPHLHRLISLAQICRGNDPIGANISGDDLIPSNVYFSAARLLIYELVRHLRAEKIR